MFESETLQCQEMPELRLLDMRDLALLYIDFLIPFNYEVTSVCFSLISVPHSLFQR